VGKDTLAWQGIPWGVVCVISSSAFCDRLILSKFTKIPEENDVLPEAISKRVCLLKPVRKESRCVLIKAKRNLTKGKTNYK